MRKHIILIMVLLLIIPLISAEVNYEPSVNSFDNQGSTTKFYLGMNISAKTEGIKVISMTKDSATTPDQCLIVQGTTKIANSSYWIGDNCTFVDPPLLDAGENYKFIMGSAGASFTRSWTNMPDPAFPIDRDYLYYHSGCEQNTGYNVACLYPGSAFMILGITINATESVSSLLNIDLFDELNQDITDPINITISNPIIPYFANYTIQNNISISGLDASNYTVSAEGSGYNYRSYVVTTKSTENTTLNIYLTKGEDVVFNYYDINTNEILSNVKVSMLKIISNDWVVIGEFYTDITGKIQVSYSPNTKYKFISELEGYNTKSFILDNILFSNYDIKMQKSVASSTDFDDIQTYWTPKNFKVNTPYDFIFNIDSPSGILDYYFIELKYPGGIINYTSNSSYGSVYTDSFIIPYGNLYETVNFSLTYDTSLGMPKTLNYNYILDVNASHNNTFMSNRDKHHGLGDFTRYMLVTLLVIVVGGFIGYYGGESIGILISIFLFGYFSFMGFISIYPAILTAFIGIIYILGRR